MGISVTVKTLSGGDAVVEAGDGASVAELKAAAAERIAIPAERQRMIFRGRVLRDEDLLKDLQLDGKAVHVVERAPTSAPGSNDNPPPRRPRHTHVHPVVGPAPDDFRTAAQNALDQLSRQHDLSGNVRLRTAPDHFHVDIRVHANRQSVDSPAVARLLFGWDQMDQLHHLLRHLDDDDLGPATGPVFTGPILPANFRDTPHGGFPEPRLRRQLDSDAREEEGGGPGQDASGHHSDGASPPSVPVNQARPGDVAEFLAALEGAEERLRRSRAMALVRAALQEERDYASGPEEDARRLSRAFQGVQQVQHALAHVRHLASDLNVPFHTPPADRFVFPRLPNESEPEDVQLSIQIQTGHTVTATFQQAPPPQPQQAPGAQPAAAAQPAPAAASAQSAPTAQAAPAAQASGGQPGGQPGLRLRVPGAQPVRVPLVQPIRVPGARGIQMQIPLGSVQVPVAVGPGGQPNIFQAMMAQMGQFMGQRGPAPQANRAPAPGAAPPMNPSPFMFRGAPMAAQPRFPRPPAPTAQPPQPAAPAQAQQASGGAGGTNGTSGTQGTQGTQGSSRSPSERRFGQPRRPAFTPEALEEADDEWRHLFVGYRAPTVLRESALYTTDPYLPCGSRHADPRREANHHLRPRITAEPQPDQPQQPPHDRPMERPQMMEHLTAQFRHLLHRPVTELTSNARRNPHGSGHLNVYEPHMLGDGRMVGLQPRSLDDYPARATGEGGTHGHHGHHGHHGPTQPHMEQHFHIEIGEEEMDDEEFQDAQEAFPPQMDVGQIMAAMGAGGMGNMGTTSVAELMRQMGAEGSLAMGSPESLMGAMYRALAESLSVGDLGRIVNGDTGPLDAYRGRIRRYLVDEVLNGNERPSAEDLRSAAGRLAASEGSQALSAVVREAHGRLEEGREVNVDASLNLCELSAMEDALLILFDHDGAPEDQPLGERLRSRAVRFLYEVLAVGSSACQGGTPAFLELVQRYTESVSPANAGQPSHMAPLVSNMMMDSIRRRSQDNPLRAEDVARFIVFKEQKAEAGAASSAAPAEAPAPTSQTSAAVSSASPQKAEPAAKVAKKEAGTREESELGDWRSAVPREWVSVMEADEARQAAQAPQPPFSDAYVNGMPPKRRRVAVEQRGGDEAALRLPSAIAAAARDVGLSLPQTAAEPDAALQTAFRASRDSLLGRQAQAFGPSLSPDRFPQAHSQANK